MQGDMAGGASVTRLAEIQSNIATGGCDQCEGAAELLAVVEALFIGANGLPRTPQRVIKGLLAWRDEVVEGCEEWRYYDGLAKAVENLT